MWSSIGVRERLDRERRAGFVDLPPPPVVRRRVS